jgi:hypothetical protein
LAPKSPIEQISGEMNNQYSFSESLEYHISICISKTVVPEEQAVM